MNNQSEYYWKYDVDNIEDQTVESYLIFDYKDRYVCYTCTEEEAQKAVDAFNNTLRAIRAMFRKETND
jgi:hypothetical protein